MGTVSAGLIEQMPLNGAFHDILNGNRLALAAKIASKVFATKSTFNLLGNFN